MYNYRDIRRVHLEISTRCNAACPDCPRNFRGVDIVDAYPILDMKLPQFKQIFKVDFVQQLTTFLINGNFGDFITARDGLAIVEYLRASNPKLRIEISTNASGQPKIWTRLGELGCVIYFRLDGLEDTHHLYRQNTDYNFIIENAKKFIAAGGHAIWAMIKFDHNEHQIDTARELSTQLGFKEFQLIDAGRDTMPVFTPDRKLSHIIGKYTGPTDFDSVYAFTDHYKVEPWGTVENEKTSYPIDCYAKKNLDVYVSANGEVYPCCWLGFYPHHSDRQATNPQLKQIMEKNNALEHGLETAIEWFSRVEESWSCGSVPAGKLFACNATCGVKS